MVDLLHTVNSMVDLLTRNYHIAGSFKEKISDCHELIAVCENFVLKYFLHTFIKIALRNYFKRV